MELNEIKQAKRVLTLLLAATLVSALAMTAYAANTTPEEFDVYVQIMNDFADVARRRKENKTTVYFYPETSTPVVTGNLQPIRTLHVSVYALQMLPEYRAQTSLRLMAKSRPMSPVGWEPSTAFTTQSMRLVIPTPISGSPTGTIQQLSPQWLRAYGVPIARARIPWPLNADRFPLEQPGRHQI